LTQDEKLCEILARLIEQQSELQTAVLSPAQATVLHVLYSFIHKNPKAPAVGLSALTAVVNSELAERGESIVNERKMGNILTSLSLTNRPRTNTGYILLLDPSTRERIHANARDHRTEDPVEDCKICAPTNAPVNRCCPPSRQDGGRKDGKDSVRAVNVVNVVNVHPEPVRRVWWTRLKAVRSSAVAVVCPSASKT
jgi:hypothetical protein